MDFAPLLMEGLTPEMEIIAETELGETPLVKKESLKKIKELIELEQDFQPFIDDKFLLMFLRCKKHDVQKAYESLKNFYRFKEKNSRVLTDFLPSEHKTIMDSNSFTALLSRDSNGCAVVIVRLGKFNWNEATIEDLFATSFTIGSLLARLEASSVCGCMILIDLKDFTMKMVFKLLSVKLWIFLIGCLQNCFPLRIKAIHIVNEPAAYHAVVSLFKLAMPKKLRERVSNLEFSTWI
ncbi:alpha-tocopherol transfer protein-like isoform X2 [Stegodyphus dumicola]|uniref:alpha-tocopherol transfer protein-like isoform X2 n=1 Tax=Stegodyphus dumicola TaxID=202533 RepID=UPI0015B2D62C|nr:alpha-tocopherol transfer protein-like isoform X2 [Stegodyphus dumicola]